MDKADKVIVLFTRYPLPGQSKTRLIPALGPDNAALLQKKMTETVVSTLRRLHQVLAYTLEIHYDGGTHTLMRSWLGASLHFIQQPDKPLGTRIEMAILSHLPTTMAILVIGSDCPDINEDILQQALQSLAEQEVVIGPTYDGGYYLIGVNTRLSPLSLHLLFKDISWGTDTVFTETLSRVKELNLKYHILEKLHDIDTPEDLRHIDYYPDPE